MAIIVPGTRTINLNDGIRTNLDYTNGVLTLQTKKTFPEAVDPSLYPSVIYVDGRNGSDTGLGTLSSPYKTVQKACSSVTIDNSLILIITAGTYDIQDGLQSILKSGIRLTYGVMNGLMGSVIFNLQNISINRTMVMSKLNQFIGITFKRTSAGYNVYEYFYDAATINLEFNNCVFDTGSISIVYPIYTGNSAGCTITKLTYSYCSFLTQFSSNDTNSSYLKGLFQYCSFKNASTFTSDPNNTFSVSYNADYSLTNLELMYGVYFGTYSWRFNFYSSEGTFISNEIDLGKYFRQITSISMVNIIPAGASIKLSTSTSSDRLTFSPFELINHSTGEINSPQGRYMKIKVELTGTEVLKQVEHHTFSSQEASQFQPNPYINFNGNLALKTSYPNTIPKDSSWQTGGSLFTTAIDKTNMYMINSLSADMSKVTWDPANKGSTVTLSNGNLTSTNTGMGSTKATHGKSTGKWYWEITVVDNSFLFIGISNSSASSETTIFNTANVRFYYYSGVKYPEVAAYGASWANNDVISVLLDMDNGKIEFWKNGVSQGDSHTDVALLGTVYPTLGSGSSSPSRAATANFGSLPFKYALPAGYSPYEEKLKFVFKDGSNIYQLIAESKDNIIPKMTSAVAPSGEVFASYYYGTTYEPYRAFNQNAGSFWDGANGTPPYTIGYKFNNQKIIRMYAVKGSANAVNYSPKDWQFQGSNDGVNYTTLDTITSAVWTASEKKIFPIANTDPYLYYRLNITASNAAYPQIDEIEMMENTDGEWLLIGAETVTAAMIDLYGISDFTQLNRKKQTIVKDLENNGALGVGKLFSYELDLKAFEHMTNIAIT
ncbi:hypothetical protein K0T92_04955 [Paenibacillus oenotherae]|uniref:B30.2/SPRY domain-containing protein n=1 Tax=Paenibacillus oenotherae TaxID=1435645 RepID=A0ABS7D2D6_9BACL|nr:SPRY domain-containing protein [Paenibacillus oenotherae]MBW7474082.1 hypothetical protein [Paenibacillus oenotherae]